MSTQFDQWLVECAAAYKGGAGFKVVGWRGLTTKFTILHPADWTGYVLAAKLKAHPDAPATLATFTAVAPVVSVEAGQTVTRFRFTLAGAAHATLPADTDLDGRTQMALIVTATSPSGEQDLYMGGRYLLLGV